MSQRAERIETAVRTAVAIIAVILAAAGCAPAQGEQPISISAPAGYGTPAPSASSLPAVTASSAATSAVTGESLDLTSLTTDYGPIVVTDAGMTVYVYAADTAGASRATCTEQCADRWPPALTDSPHPAVVGISGAVGTIPAADGGYQLTLAGQPLYTFTGDEMAGQTNGQLIEGTWWIVTPAGERITGAVTP